MCSHLVTVSHLPTPNDEVDVWEEEEYSDGEGGADWWVEGSVWGAVEVDMYKAVRDKDIDDSEGVRYQAKEKVDGC